MDERDEQSKSEVRRRMLIIARLYGPRYENGWVPAGNFLRAEDDHGVAVGEEAEAVAMLEDLLTWGLLEEFGGMDLGGTRPAFRHRRFRLARKGHALWMREIEPIPGVADERFGD